MLPVAEYVRAQGRFRDLGDAEIEAIQAQVTERVEFLLRNCDQPD